MRAGCFAGAAASERERVAGFCVVFLETVDTTIALEPSRFSIDSPGFWSNYRLPMNLARGSGVQLHISSLPSGRLGPDAYAFVDWLGAAGQSWWQVLPLGPPDRWRSPYRSSSAFACWRGFLADPGAPVSADDEADFCARQAYWIEDWARFAGGRRAVRDQIRFEREWGRLRRYAADSGVALIGDLPIYVAAGSADHAAHPELFRSQVVAGAPPDPYSDRGQLWGNPVYDWPALRRRRYRWWVARIRRAQELFDVARIDHFRGFVAFWEVPESSADARGGHWRRGPGAAPFHAAQSELGELRLIAEDLGVITEPVRRLRRELGLPGMAVLQFAFGPDLGPDSPERIENLERDLVFYTGTHDHDTLSGWWSALDAGSRERVRAAMASRGIRPGSAPWGLIRLAYACAPARVMVQLQDVLGLDSEARMNTPGRASGNWSWRLRPGMLSSALAQRLRSATAEAGRLP